MKSFRILRTLISDSYQTLKLDIINRKRYSRIYFDKKTYISTIDGVIPHGGLSDRLCGIISTYKYAKEKGYLFKILHTYPFKLNLYLEPNKYDWLINDNSIIKRQNFIKNIRITQISDKKYIASEYSKFRLNSYFKTNFVYSNMHYFSSGEDFSKHFNELFQPSPVLSKMINDQLNQIGHKYISLTFRFQQLLGDFKETGFPELRTHEEKVNLINKCLSVVERLHDIDPRPILITSESKTFLEIVKQKLDYAYVLPGNVIHMDFVDPEDNVVDDSQLKSFLDMYMVANANCIYLANIQPLYHSSFPRVSSWIYNKTYKEIELYPDGSLNIIENFD